MSLGALWRRVAIVVVLVSSLAGTARAVLIAEDSFDYEPGELGDEAGGTGWSGAWYPSASGSSVVSPGMTYSAGVFFLRTPGNRVREGGWAWRDIDMSALDPGLLDGGKLGRDDTTLWISFICHDFTGYGQWGGLALYDVANEELFIGEQIAATTWGFDHSISEGQSSVLATTEAFLVTRIDFAAGNEDLYLWVNPALGAEPNIADADVVDSDSFWLTGVRMGSGSGPGEYHLDELRIGTTFRDVAPVDIIPEPCTLTLLALGGLGLLRRRRRATS